MSPGSKMSFSLPTTISNVVMATRLWFLALSDVIPTAFSAGNLQGCIMFSLTGLAPRLSYNDSREVLSGDLLGERRKKKQGSHLRKEATYSDNGKKKDGEEKNKAFRS